MRIAISGTYGTGKSTLARAVSERTGWPLVGARGMRDFLADHFDAKPLTRCTPAELIELGVRRFEERVASEAAAGEFFVSDGSTLNEWAYAHARRTLGIHAGDGVIRDASTGTKFVFDQVLEHLGRVFRDHARHAYDLVIHLPIEFPMHHDGHRPVRDDYRNLSDALLRTGPAELGLRVLAANGSIAKRLTTVTELMQTELTCWRLPLRSSRPLDAWGADPAASLP